MTTPMRGIALFLLALTATAQETRNDFSGGEGQTPFVFRKRAKADAKPVLKDGRLQMLFGRAEQKCSAGFERTVEGPFRRIEAGFRATLSGQNEGFSFALLHTGRFGQKNTTRRTRRRAS